MQCATTNPLFLSLILWGSTKAPSKSGFAYKISVVSISLELTRTTPHIRIVLNTLYFYYKQLRNTLTICICNLLVYFFSFKVKYIHISISHYYTSCSNYIVSRLQHYAKMNLHLIKTQTLKYFRFGGVTFTNGIHNNKI